VLGAWYPKIWQKLDLFVVLHISTWGGMEICLGEAMRSKAAPAVACCWQIAPRASVLCAVFRERPRGSRVRTREHLGRSRRKDPIACKPVSHACPAHTVNALLNQAPRDELQGLCLANPAVPLAQVPASC